ncbi:DUF4177 domain-containing protein [Clostridium polynesiense]|uniref:DUF4177 domain-containing protein n=1 Tax=Clostridium polynesiense TaxID=1325933 RepID=UPI00058C9D2A|nr:DUF4177 domain-containing protein [Clostridium polynesiense]
MNWVYKVVTMDHFISSDSDSTVEEELNKYGSEGWECLGTMKKPYATVGKPSKLDYDCLVFKKEVK